MLNLIIALIIAGGLLYILPRLPLDATIKLIIQVLIIVILCIMLLKEFWPATGLG